ncbi:MAG TPA: hypothetical protein VJ603_01340 [Paucimonas sp.]|nr:hypothetical protein [Paucimonas sp.]
MAVSFDRNGLPSCCGVGLIPGEPQTECPRCRARYDTSVLSLAVQELKAGRQIESITLPVPLNRITTDRKLAPRLKASA